MPHRLRLIAVAALVSAAALDARPASAAPDAGARPPAPGATPSETTGPGSAHDAGAAGVPAVGAPQRDGGLDGGDVPTWVLSQKLGRDAGLGLREALVRDLCAPPGPDAGVGETPLTPAEADALLDDPRAELVYGEKTVSIVAPSMRARHRQEHLDLMKLFLAPERVDAGVAFAHEKAAVLDATEKRTGVRRGVIVGILMWESKLGTITGNYRAFNVFTSQAFFVDEANAVALSRVEEKKGLDAAQQVRRVETIRERARRNLLALARQCKTRGMDTLEVKGSWAGALGFPQFMPASLRWAEDGNGDGRIDLFEMDDSIASVGRYLAEHGFKDSPRSAVWEYNHEDAYVQGVLAYGDALEAALAARGGADGGTTRGSAAHGPRRDRPSKEAPATHAPRPRSAPRRR